jgi:hypothetical protein
MVLRRHGRHPYVTPLINAGPERVTECTYAGSFICSAMVMARR